MSEKAARQEVGIRFLERQGWNPARAKVALAEYQARPSEELRLDLVQAVDATLKAFRRSLCRRVSDLNSQGFALEHRWVRELTMLHESAGVLMTSRVPTWLDGKGQLCYSGEKQHTAS